MDVDLEALKAAALATISKKAENEKEAKPVDQLAALRAAALLSKASKTCDSNGSGGQAVLESSTAAAASSKFSRLESAVESDEGSEISILEEVERGASDNDVVDLERVSSTEKSDVIVDEVQAIPDLLDDSVDITEFDDDDLLPEDEPGSVSTTKPNSMPQFSEQPKTNLSSFNGIENKISDKSLNISRGDRTLSPGQRRSRSRSPRLPRSRSPRRRRARSPPAYRTPPPITSPHQCLSPHRNPPSNNRSNSPSLSRRRHLGDNNHRHKRLGSPDTQRPTVKERLAPSNMSSVQVRVKDRLAAPARSSADSTRVRDKPAKLSEASSASSRVRDRIAAPTGLSIEPSEVRERLGTPEILSTVSTRVTEKLAVPDPLADPTLTEEERRTLITRKKKFSKTKKVSTTKKTIKLKKTKKKTTVTKRLGAKKPKVIKVKSKSPEIVETVSLQQVETSAKASNARKATSSLPQVVKKRIKDRLGGYQALDGSGDSTNRKRRLVSIEKPSSVSSESSISMTEALSEASDASPQRARLSVDDVTEPLSKSTKLYTAAEDTKASDIRTLSPRKRNIWSTRSTVDDLSDGDTSTVTHSIDLVSKDHSRGTSRVTRETDAFPSDLSGRLGRRISHEKDRSAPSRSIGLVPGDLYARLGKTSRDSDQITVSHNPESSSGGRRMSRSGSQDSRKVSQIIPSTWSSSRRHEERPSSSQSESDQHATSSESKGKSKKEQDLDERIRKIKEKNIKLEQRQKEIERERALYG